MSSSFSCGVSSLPEFGKNFRCKCGNLLPIKMSWSYANPGKRYQACPRYGVSCFIFIFRTWVDMDVSDRVAIIIRGLLKRLDKNDMEIQKLKYTIEKEEIEIQKLSLKVMKMKFQKQTGGDNKFQFYKGVACGLVVATIFFQFVCKMHIMENENVTLLQLN
nr:uncharacterized protein LOC109167351 [Ipomoea batatas]